MATIEERIVQNAICNVESQIDNELEKLDRVDGSSLEKLRAARIREMKEEAQLRSQWSVNGHGEYTEIEEKEFFNVCKKSPDMIVHFYKRDVPRCTIFDHHLKSIAAEHLEARFVKLNAEKAPFLAVKLGLSVIPTLIVIVGGKTKDCLIGFSELGNRDDFSTATLEWRLSISGVIKYDGDISQPPTLNPKTPLKKINWRRQKTIREDSTSEED